MVLHPHAHRFVLPPANGQRWSEGVCACGATKHLSNVYPPHLDDPREAAEAARGQERGERSPVTLRSVRAHRVAQGARERE